MRRILLTGAGFSKNWGGPLASEVLRSLIADQEIRANPSIRALLLNDKNYEVTLSQLQANKTADPESLKVLESAILRVFSEMTEVAGFV